MAPVAPLPIASFFAVQIVAALRVRELCSMRRGAGVRTSHSLSSLSAIYTW